MDPTADGPGGEPSGDRDEEPEDPPRFRSDIDAELIDLRTLLPLDLEAVAESVQKTRRCVVVHEATRTGGYGAELVADVQEECFWHLEAPIQRVTGWDTPYPHAFEWDYFPGQDRIIAAMRCALEV